ncbi:hypothetical protein OG723_44015 (plasmid) [Streptomyces sp. NBC_01278]|uniref:hypothetical protein n=1 Tax=Streptomyces sp. NBC_01278 TaxID=2903809 RepID=UPI002E34DBF0|nr:hypothetical protein [Streptomyces sp. NBC_01278]
MSTTATHITADIAAVTVISGDPAVTDWAARYFGPWWNATDINPGTVCAGPIIAADVADGAYTRLHDRVLNSPHTSAEYAKAPVLVATAEDGTITAVSPKEQLAYLSEPITGRIKIAGTDPLQVSLATARIARDCVRGQLLRDGWTVLHASAVVLNDRTLLTFGDKGAGKTTTALTLAARSGAHLLANDRVFARADAFGNVRILPWPSAAALGLGLLGSLGLYEKVADRLAAGESLHPTQDDRVTTALQSGDLTPRWDGGRELKAQVFPDQFANWFGLTLATEGMATDLLFPQISAGAEPTLHDTSPSLGDSDFMQGATEDRYPDILGLAQGITVGGTSSARDNVRGLLGLLPHHAFTLGHDHSQAAAFLTKLINA